MEGRRPFISGDPLRAIAALAVLLFHAAVFAYVGRGGAATGGLKDAFGSVLGPALGSLDVGLYLFFVLSGYLVGGPFIRWWIWGRERPRLRRYAERRARRIVPAFWLVSALILLRHGTLGSSAREVGAIFAFVQNFDPSPLTDRLFIQTWTLDVEAAFYVVLPLLALAAAAIRKPQAPRSRMVLALAVIAVVAAASIALRMSVDDSRGVLGRSLAALAFAFAPGLLLAAVEPAATARLRGSGAAKAIALGLLATGLAAFVALTQTALSREDHRAPWLVLCAGALVAAALVWQWGTGAAPAWLNVRPLHALGRWSYGIYLVHVAVLADLVRLVPDDASPREAFALLAPGAAAISIALAAASWRWFERPIVEGRAPFRPGRARQTVPPEAEVAP